MVAHPSIDPTDFLHEHLAQASPVSPASKKGPLLGHELGTTSAVAGRGWMVV